MFARNSDLTALAFSAVAGPAQPQHLPEQDAQGRNRPRRPPHQGLRPMFAIYQLIDDLAWSAEVHGIFFSESRVIAPSAAMRPTSARSTSAAPTSPKIEPIRRSKRELGSAATLKIDGFTRCGPVEQRRAEGLNAPPPPLARTERVDGRRRLCGPGAHRTGRR